MVYSLLNIYGWHFANIWLIYLHLLYETNWKIRMDLSCLASDYISDVYQFIVKLVCDWFYVSILINKLRFEYQNSVIHAYRRTREYQSYILYLALSKILRATLVLCKWIGALGENVIIWKAYPSMPFSTDLRRIKRMDVCGLSHQNVLGVLVVQCCVWHKIREIFGWSFTVGVS